MNGDIWRQGDRDSCIGLFRCGLRQGIGRGYRRLGRGLRTAQHPLNGGVELQTAQERFDHLLKCLSPHLQPRDFCLDMLKLLLLVLQALL